MVQPSHRDSIFLFVSQLCLPCFLVLYKFIVLMLLSLPYSYSNYHLQTLNRRTASVPNPSLFHAAMRHRAQVADGWLRLKLAHVRKD